MPSAAAPVVVCRSTVGDDEAQQLWNWQLRRQGLASDSRMDSVPAIARAAVGLHAARLPSPFSTVAARASAPEVALSLLSAAGRSGVMTVRCMRKTLHVLPLTLAVVAHSATIHFRERDALRAIVNAGVGPRTVSRVTVAIHSLLAREGPLFHRMIETHLVGPRTPVAAIRLALKLSWERGSVTYVNDTTGWNRENRTFALTSTLYPHLDMRIDRSAASATLICHYFDCYGPASIRDVTWWSGLSRASVIDAMATSSRDFVAVETPWCDEVTYMYVDQFEAFRGSGLVERHTGVNLLAHEDVALKAYFESRRRYLGTLPARRAFNQIGEAYPTVLADGQVVGTWAWDSRTRTVGLAIERGYASPKVHNQAKRISADLTDVLRLGWTPAKAR